VQTNEFYQFINGTEPTEGDGKLDVSAFSTIGGALM